MVLPSIESKTSSTHRVCGFLQIVFFHITSSKTLTHVHGLAHTYVISLRLCASIDPMQSYSMSVYTYIVINVYIYMFLPVYKYKFIYIYMYVCLYVHIHMYLCIHVYIYIFMHAYYPAHCLLCFIIVHVYRATGTRLNLSYTFHDCLRWRKESEDMMKNETYKQLG